MQINKKDSQEETKKVVKESIWLKYLAIYCLVMPLMREYSRKDWVGALCIGLAISGFILDISKSGWITYKGPCPYCGTELQKVRNHEDTCPSCKKTFLVRENSFFKMY